MRKNAAVLAMLTILAAAPFVRAQTKKELRYNLGPNGTVTIVNPRGNINVKPGAGRQILISASLPNEQIGVEGTQTGNRVEVRTHAREKSSAEMRVDFEVSVPADAGIRIDSANGDIRIENVRGDLNVANDAGTVEIRNAAGGVQVQTVSASINLAEAKQARVQLASAGGNITMTNVSGPTINAKSTNGAISYIGNFDGGGNYSFINHAGEINVTLPTSASVDLIARSIKGTVENDFPFQKKEHVSVPNNDSRSLAGRSKDGASSVELRTFSGRIRVKKQ
jgi:DUF4097 and DUF4098 domain-containing protein YvlB